MKKNMLFITPGSPFYDCDGLAKYSRSILDAIKDSFDLNVITLGGNCEDSSLNIELLNKKKFRQFLSFFSGKSSKFFEYDINKSLVHLVDNVKNADFIVFNHRISIIIYIRLFEMDESIFKGKELFYVNHNDEYRSINSSHSHSNFFVKTLSKVEARKVRNEELFLMNNARGVSFINSEDIEGYQNKVQLTKSAVISFPYEITNEPFVMKNTKNLNLLLFGSFSWAPKRSAAKWLIDSVSEYNKIAGFSLNLVIAGKGAGSLNYGSDNLTLIESPSDSQLGSIYSEADIFVIPDEQEGGLKLKSIEAAARGVPILSTREGISGSNLINNHSAIVFNKNNFIKKLNHMVEDGYLRERLRENALGVISSNNSKDTLCKQWVNFFCVDF